MIFNKFEDIIKSGKKYNVIYADCPWKYSNKQPLNVLPYSSMSKKELKELPVKDILDDKAILFFWAVNPLLDEAIEVINSWGFKFKHSWIWDKQIGCHSYYGNAQVEFLMIATKGYGFALGKGIKRPKSLISIKKGKHSEKPKYFIDKIDELYPNGNRIELFAREGKEGYDLFGNQSEYEKRES